MRRFLARKMLVVLAALALAATADALTYDPDAWLADLDRLEADMAQGYANLDWMVGHRGMDLARLDRETRARLADAHSRVRAFVAMRDFVHAFRDPHLKLAWGERPVAGAPALVPDAAAATTAATHEMPADPPAGKDCASAGYEEEGHEFRFPLASMAGWKPLAEGDFPAGLVGDVGVLRIAQFGEDRYGTRCEEVFKPGIGRHALKLAVRARLQAQLAERIAMLQRAGARRLLVDVSGNGGGTEWVSDVVALMTTRPLARPSPRMVAPTCDRGSIWRGGTPCPVLEPAGEPSQLQGTGPWNGPVLVLADRGTGSASEDFVAWLRINGVARVLGEPTAGAGCGYVNGGQRSRFRASRFDVLMPNCARFLPDGRNEIEGIPPDLALPMTAEDAVRARALQDALAMR
jgi:hypothetical protein